MSNELILIKLWRVTEWRPLSRTSKLDRLKTELTDEEIDKLTDEFARHITKLIVGKAKECIRTQRFPVRYPPLNKEYRERKKREGYHTGFWIKTGWTLEHIKAWRYGDVWYVGFPRDAKRPDGTPALKAAWTVEFGSVNRNVPPRPLLRPIAGLVSKSITFHFKKFLERDRPELVGLVDLVDEPRN